MSRIRVMLVDDHAIVRSGFRRLLDQYPEMEVIAESGDAAHAYHEHARLSPDVLVLDLSMPGVGGMELLRRVRARTPEARVIVFSMHEDATLAQRAMNLGACGYVSKSNAPEVLADAVLAVASGQIYLSPDMALTLTQLRSSGHDHPLQALSAREYEIFRQIIAGRSGTEIAAALNLSSKTIANYRTAIKQKLRVTSDVELVRLAMGLDRA